MAKGWTEQEAKNQARLWETIYSRSEAVYRIEWDVTWDEWVIVSRLGQDATVQRKPRRGLRQNWRKLINI